jgi:hypothetical protein
MYLNLENKRFGRLLVIKQVARKHPTKVRWLCLCDCGNYKEINTQNLRSKMSQSCGCLHKDVMRIQIQENFKLTPEKRKKWYEKMVATSRTQENRDRARKQMLEMRKDPVFLEKSRIARAKKIFGKNNPFFGKKHKVETRIKISENKKNSPLTPRGEKNKAWIDGRGNDRKRERTIFQQTLEYKLFVEGVLKRDNFSCVLCGVRGVKFHVDHIKEYKNYPELRTELSNGRTLCVSCHRKTENYGRKQNKII